VGGSSSGYSNGQKVNTSTVIVDILNAIHDDDRLYKLSLALEADGDAMRGENLDYLNVPGVESVMSELDPESALGEYNIQNQEDYNKIQGQLNNIFEDSSAIIEEEGYLQNSDTRDEWEKKYYGKVVGGPENGVKYANSILSLYVKDYIGSANIIEPKKMRAKKLTDPRDIFYNKYSNGSNHIFDGDTYRVVSHFGFGKNNEDAIALRSGYKEKIIIIGGKIIDVPRGKHYYDYEG